MILRKDKNQSCLESFSIPGIVLFLNSRCKQYETLCHELAVTSPCTRCTVTMQDVTNGTYGDMRNRIDTLLEITVVKKILNERLSLNKSTQKRSLRVLKQASLYYHTVLCP